MTSVHVTTPPPACVSSGVTGDEEGALAAFAATPKRHLGGRGPARQDGLDAGQEIAQGPLVGHSGATGLEVILAPRDAGTGTIDAGRRGRPGLVHGGDAPFPVQHCDGASDRTEDGAIDVLRPAQPGFRPSPRVAVRDPVRGAVLRQLHDGATVHVERLHEPPERLADRRVQWASPYAERELRERLGFETLLADLAILFQRLPVNEACICM